MHYRLIWTLLPEGAAKRTRTYQTILRFAGFDLHEVTLENGEPLYLVTTLKVSSETAAECYGRRYDVEHDIRDMKVSLGIENIRAKSDEMVQKELLCSVVAYNLVVELRRQAAKIAEVEPRRLSFTGVWTTMQVYLLQQPPCSASEWQERYERALRSAQPMQNCRTDPDVVTPRIKAPSPNKVDRVYETTNRRENPGGILK